MGGQWMCVIILACCSMCMTRTKTVMWSSLPTQAKQNKPCLPWSPSCRSKCDIFSSKVVAYFLIICNFFSIKNKSQYSDVNKLQVWLYMSYNRCWRARAWTKSWSVSSMWKYTRNVSLFFCAKLIKLQLDYDAELAKKKLNIFAGYQGN